MAIKIEMPKLSDTMEEGVIGKWNVKEGDKVESGDIIAEVETDKATMEVEVFDDGTILKILADEGDAVPLGKAKAIIGEEGEDISDLLEEAESGPSKEKEKGKKEEEEGGAEPEKKAAETTAPEEKEEGGRVKASPLARKMAEEQGINLSEISGSGPGGRIIKKDIKEYEAPSGVPAAPVAQAGREDKEIRVSQMRKTIAKRLAESKFSNPHYYETIDIDMEPVFAARKKLNESSDVKISFNDIVIKACSVALRRHPAINSSWQGDTILQHGDVNVAFAVAVEEGLVTPVINHSDMKGLAQISHESKELAEKARDRKLDSSMMEGSTFTISNLGMFGIEEFTAIINPPNSCIMAVGAIRDVPVVENGEIVPGKRMKVTLSSDHRIVDGVTAAKFLNTVRDYLENPIGMLL